MARRGGEQGRAGVGEAGRTTVAGRAGEPAQGGEPGAGAEFRVEELATLVAVAARRWPERVAWTFDQTGVELSFAEVHRRSDELAFALAARGVRPGDRVALMLRNQPEFPLCWLAIAKLGAIMVPVNVQYRELDATHVLAHSGARIVVAAAEFVRLLDAIRERTELEVVLTPAELGDAPVVPLVAPVAEQAVNIQYTSGTTGRPKGCVLPHRYWLTLAGGLVRDFPAIDERDVLLTAQPFHYIDPQWNVVLGLLAGARLVVLDRFHPASFAERVRHHEVTWFYCLGLMPTLLLRQPASALDTAHRVRAVYASAIPLELHAELERRWGVPWFEAFGMTETGGDIRDSVAGHETRVGTGCLGLPTPEREAMIADESGEPLPRGHTGELVLRGSGMMQGYYRDPAATALVFRGGWFHTGDLARMDEQGRIYYVGRTKDMIRRSGENIAAAEVEQALLLHPDVRLAAVVAVPDELRGEEVLAYVVPADGVTADPVALAEFCAGQLAYFKVPRFWVFRDALPLTASERVAKGELPRVSAGSFDRVEARWV
ncbi:MULTISPECIES: AMP-binding protein [unclassified Crossiella]|uniref:AMP-binding protein n=1 Tax=unclassified Crossiella TaxID=2620835 RepID=UPI0020004879|nr:MULTISPECIES: AMP-binding protein [unclassified Crossiella]MCK2239876.1 AMP-binding protein [Crossiella sp. S99.2]MCK2252584.1 AMP-binding protein [Crossiella sp. S99.1]